MAIMARIPRPRSATAATRGRETPLVSGSPGAMLAEALADGLADAVAEGLADGLAEGVVISSCAEAAGTEISEAAVESMTRHSSRFKAPTCLFSVASHERCLHLSRSRATRHNHYKTSVRFYVRTVLVGCSARKKLLDGACSAAW
jgi:hypothetical protein